MQENIFIRKKIDRRNRMKNKRILKKVILIKKYWKRREERD